MVAAAAPEEDELAVLVPDVDLAVPEEVLEPEVFVELDDFVFVPVVEAVPVAEEAVVEAPDAVEVVKVVAPVAEAVAAVAADATHALLQFSKARFSAAVPLPCGQASMQAMVVFCAA